MEDELAGRVAAGAVAQPDFAFHYQKMLSDIWGGSAYEIVRALVQRSGEAVNHPGARLFNPSVVARMKALHADLERLRVPMEKYEIARDSSLKEPVRFVPINPSIGPATEFVYDPQNPHRDHLMASGISDHGSVMWLAFDAVNRREYWIDRKDLADRFLKLVD